MAAARCVATGVGVAMGFCCAADAGGDSELSVTGGACAGAEADADADADATVDLDAKGADAPKIDC